MNSMITNIKRNSLLAATTMLFATTFTLRGVEAQSDNFGITIDLFKGPTYDFGATPWYTGDFTFTSPSVKPQSKRVLPFTVDTGTTMIWATLDTCSTDACTKHTDNDSSHSGIDNMVSYLQTGVDYDLANISVTEQVNFGPWGTMGADIAQSKVAIKNVNIPIDNLFGRPLQFIGANDYSEDQFRTLNWYGGIGLPSRGKYSVDYPILNKDMKGYGNDFFFGQLHQSMININLDFKPRFSNWYNAANKTGHFLLGADDPNQYEDKSELLMTKNNNVIDGSKDMWATDLMGLKVGGRDIKLPPVSSFFVDSGSSRFKGDYLVVEPILTALYDPQVHEKILGTDKINEGLLIGLKYKPGKKPDPRRKNTKLWQIYVGKCENSQRDAYITLNENDYSYEVKVPNTDPDSKEPEKVEYYVALHALGAFPNALHENEIGGLLAGTQLMEKFYTTFVYDYDEENKQYSQNGMSFQNNKDVKFNGNSCSSSYKKPKARMRSSVKAINLKKF